MNPLPLRCVRLFACLLVLAAAALPVRAEDRAAVIVAIGAAGEEAYQGVFERWAGHWEKACTAGGAKRVEIGRDPNATDSLEALRAAVAAEPAEGATALWLVLLGHGTFDGKEGKFNLRGDDLSATELAGWLGRFRRPVVVVAGFSSSGAFLKPLTGPGRVIVTATRNGRESNYARFGGYFSEAIGDPSGDVDKDGATSVLEAWLAAARRTEEFYKGEGRLSSEHALLEDNGDGAGTPPGWFEGVRVVKKAKTDQAPDGTRAHQIHLVESAAERSLPPEVRQERDAAERELAALREKKATMPEAEYYEQLEAVLLRLARIYGGK